MEFLVTVREVVVSKETVCIFIGETVEGPLKFVIAKRNIALANKVTPGAKLLVNATLKLKEVVNGDKIHRENALYVNEV